jgi:carboxylate-amine ligase
MEARELLLEILEFVAAEVEESGNEREMARLERIMRERTGADRQLAVWERTGDIEAVVDHVVDETCEGLRVTHRRVA